MDLSGRVAVVTGASMGIGEAVARIFADQGAGVVFLSRDAGRAEAARQRAGHTDRTIALACDVRNREEIDRIVGLTLHHFARIDIWVNNAGHGLRASVADAKMTDVRNLFETNFFGAVEAIEAVVPVMKQQASGTIINISSVAGHLPLPFSAFYCATKFAMNAIGEAARIELANSRIHVLTVCPGYVRTNFSSNVVRSVGAKDIRPASVHGISAERVARAVLRAYQKQKRVVVVPWFMHPVIKLYQLFPGFVEWGISRKLAR
jgi:uncharacterized protein